MENNNLEKLQWILNKFFLQPCGILQMSLGQYSLPVSNVALPSQFKKYSVKNQGRYQVFQDLFLPHSSFRTHVMSYFSVENPPWVKIAERPVQSCPHTSAVCIQNVVLPCLVEKYMHVFGRQERSLWNLNVLFFLSREKYGSLNDLCQRQCVSWTTILWF